MSTRKGPEIALGISGGIGAYKTPELVRALVHAGVEVTAVLTKNAEAFVTPLTLQTVTGRPVIRDLYDLSGGGDVEHIDLARRISVLAVAPATAATLARLAHGLAQDFLSTFYLAVSCPVLVAPSMNTRMLEHPATVANLSILKSRGVQVLEPGSGELACGDVGRGRLPEIDLLVREILRLADRKGSWSGETVLVTAGPTREYLDPARVLTNPSSGRMGYAVAEEALVRGARVLLVSGPSPLPAPSGAEVVRVETTEEMRVAVLDALPRATVVIKAAAPADFRPTHVDSEKVPKARRTHLDLEPTPDILLEIAQKRNGQLVVGFSAGTGDYREAARRKLRDKQLDLVVANPIDRPGAGFESETNEGTMIAADGVEETLPRLSKREMAGRLLDRIESLKKGGR